MIFQPKTLDFDLSPYTGLTRESWIEAGEYLLNGVFGNIEKFEDPVVMPRKETEVTYPHLKAPQGVQESQRKADPVIFHWGTFDSYQTGSGITWVFHKGIL